MGEIEPSIVSGTNTCNPRKVFSLLLSILRHQHPQSAKASGTALQSANSNCNISRKASRARKFVRNVEAKVQRERKSAVLRVRRLAGRRLTFMLAAEDDSLRQFAEESKTGRAGKTLVKEGPLRITLVALKKVLRFPRIMWRALSVSRLFVAA